MFAVTRTGYTCSTKTRSGRVRVTISYHLAVSVPWPFAAPLSSPTQFIKLSNALCQRDFYHGETRPPAAFVGTIDRNFSGANNF